MNNIEAAVILLRRHNRWRRGDETVSMVDAALLGCAIDVVCDTIEKQSPATIRNSHQEDEVLRKATEYASDIVKWLHRDHYADNTTFEPFDDLLGLLSQIDNMICGWKEPVAVPDYEITENLAALVGRLAHQLRRAKPTHTLPAVAMNYLDSIGWKFRAARSNAGSDSVDPETADVVYRWRALDNSGYCYGSNPPSNLPERCCLTAYSRQVPAQVPDDVAQILDAMASVGAGGASHHYVTQWARELRAMLAAAQKKEGGQ